MPRFDLILAEAKRQSRSKTSQGMRQKPHRFDKFEHLQELTDDSKPLKSYPAPFDVKAFKLKFLKGQDYNITEFLEVKNAIKETSYQSELKAKKTPAPPKRGPLRERNSCSATGVMPDPKTMGMNAARLSNFSKDLRNMT